MVKITLFFWVISHNFDTIIPTILYFKDWFSGSSQNIRLCQLLPLHLMEIDIHVGICLGVETSRIQRELNLANRLNVATIRILIP